MSVAWGQTPPELQRHGEPPPGPVCLCWAHFLKNNCDCISKFRAVAASTSLWQLELQERALLLLRLLPGLTYTPWHCYISVYKKKKKIAFAVRSQRKGVFPAAYFLLL